MTPSDTIITVTEAARNFADCVNRAIYQHQSFLLTKNGVPVARLVPASPATCTGQSLADALGGVELSHQDATAWNADLKLAKKSLKKPSDKWK